MQHEGRALSAFWMMLSSDGVRRKHLRDVMARKRILNRPAGLWTCVIASMRRRATAGRRFGTFPQFRYLLQRYRGVGDRPPARCRRIAERAVRRNPGRRRLRGEIIALLDRTS